MAVIGELITKLSAETSSFTTAMTDAATKTDWTAKSMLAAATSGPVLAGAVVGVGAALVGMVAHAAEAADQLIRVQAISGLSYDNLQELQFIASQTSVSFESITNASAMMTRNMGQSAASGGDLEAKMQALGIATRDTSGAARSQNDVFNDTLRALAKMPPGMEQSAAGAAIFGRGFRELLPLLAEGEGGIDRMRGRAHELGAVMGGESVAALDTMGDKFSELGTSMSGAGNTIAVSLLPIIETGLIPLLDLLIGAVTKTADVFAGIEQDFEWLGYAIGNWVRGVKTSGDAHLVHATAAKTNATATGELTEAAQRAASASMTAKTATDDGTYAYYAQTRALRDLKTAQEAVYSAIYDGTDAASQLAPAVAIVTENEGKMAIAAWQVGDAMTLSSREMVNYGRDAQAVTGLMQESWTVTAAHITGKIGQIMGAISNLESAFGIKSESKLGKFTSGAMAGMGAGAAVGSLFGPAGSTVGTAVGTVIGGVVGGIRGLFSHSAGIEEIGGGGVSLQMNIYGSVGVDDIAAQMVDALRKRGLAV